VPGTRCVQTSLVFSRLLTHIETFQKATEPEEDETAKLKAQLASKKITCRICTGEHYTTRCPYKDTLGGVPGVGGDGAGEENADPTPAAASTTGKYVPVHLRGGNRVGETMNGRTGSRDDLPTLRVTNLSEDANDNDLWDLFGRFGRINRIYVGKDQETGLCKGFAFVSFEDKDTAEKAMKKINGMPYDHLILSCQWSGMCCSVSFIICVWMKSDDGWFIVVPRGEREQPKA
jgi:translation initiation factor 3 subunit G